MKERGQSKLEIVEKIYERAPEGWQVVGSFTKNMATGEVQKSGIAGTVERNKNWVTAKIAKLLAQDEAETDPEKKHSRWQSKEYLDRGNRIAVHYGPEMITELSRLAKLEKPAPPGWKVVGIFTHKTTKPQKNSGISGTLGRSPNWVTAKIAKLLAQDEAETDPEKKHSGWQPEEYLDRSNKLTTHYGPEMIAELDRLAKLEKPASPKWEVVGVFTKDPATGEITEKSGMAGIVEKNRDWVNTKIAKLLAQDEAETDPEKKHSGWQPEEYLDSGDRLATHYGSEMITELSRLAKLEKTAPPQWEVMGNFRKNTITGEITEKTGISGIIGKGRDWVNTKIAKLLAQDEAETDPEKKHSGWQPEEYLDKNNHPNLHYGPEMIAELDRLAKSEKSAPPGWEVVGDFNKNRSTGVITRKTGVSGIVGRDRSWVNTKITKLIAQDEAETDPEKKHSGWQPEEYLDKKKRLTAHYGPEMIAELDRLAKSEKSAPPGWEVVGSFMKNQTTGEITEKTGISGIVRRNRSWVNTKITKLIAQDEAETDPEKKHSGWQPEEYLDRKNRIAVHYGPEMIAELQKLAALETDRDILTKIETEDREDVRHLVEEIAEGNTELAKHLRKLIEVLGASCCVDILFTYRPEFRGLEVEYVESLLADYLGDFLSTKYTFNPEFLREIPPIFLSEPSLRAGLYETIKNHCLKYYFAVRRQDPDVDALAIIESYITHISESLGETHNSQIDDVIQDVLLYYDSAIRDFVKPAKFVDRLSEGREFPDINQKINMKELEDKKRLLIADEMGLGKSASVIMAKEHMGVGCALVVVPFNVLETWRKYLSDDPKEGYFKPEQAPRVLVANSPDKLKDIAPGQYDYILLSQGRLDARYVKNLKAVPFDMLIVDEIHSLKNPKGERSQQLEVLAGIIEKNNKYLALLSGTPVPNKVQDLAVILKLLYPAEYGKTPASQLARQIIRSDLAKLRRQLLPRLQMKNLEDSVDIPPLHERTVDIELGEEERNIYQAIIEDDELDATDKIRILRQLVLNPRIAEAAPTVEGGKAKTVGAKLRAAFTHKKRIVLFVNDYIEGVIRGKTTIIDQLELPSDVEVRLIHGPVGETERNAIQTEFNNGGDKKILLIVSGDTADVGVDFTGAEQIDFYNDPWTLYKKRQERARGHRPRLKHELSSTTYIAKGTIEEGIRDYIARKYKAIEKLLRGIPRSELDNAILMADEKNVGSLEDNPELAEYFFSSLEKLLKFFGYTRHLGEAALAHFVEEFGREYAQGYTNMGGRSYQANVNRMAGTIIDRFVSQQKHHPGDVRILDVASGPEMLKRHVPDVYQKRVISIDMNRHHFSEASTTAVAGSMSAIPFRENCFEYVNCSLAWPDTDFDPKKKNYERLKLLQEANRVLKPGGRLIISLMYNITLSNPTEFAEAVSALGFKVLPDFTTTIEEGNYFATNVISLEKIANCSTNLEEIVGAVAHNIVGFELADTNATIKNSRKMLSKFIHNKEIIDVEFNAEDLALKRAEEKSVADGTLLKDKHGGIEHIPVEELRRHGFTRILRKNAYILFKVLSRQNGVVIIR